MDDIKGDAKKFMLSQIYLNQITNPSEKVFWDA